MGSADHHERLKDVEAKIKLKVSRRAKVRQLLDRLGDQLKRLRKDRRKLKKKIKAEGGRRTPSVVIERSVVNQSSRGGVAPRIIVLHSTESSEQAGNADLAAIVSWFDNSSAQASSHVITDADGNSARCVPDSAKAWTQAYFNPVSLSVEQIGRAAQTSWDDDLVRETARWIAKWSRDFGIPIVRGAVSGSSVTRSGVVTHAELGAAGGGHHDPGAGFPIGRCLELAAAYR